MKAQFEELDDQTRKYMLEEFEKEQKSGNPYTSSRLSNIGKEVFPSFMKETILNGDEECDGSNFITPNDNCISYDSHSFVSGKLKSTQKLYFMVF